MSFFRKKSLFILLLGIILLVLLVGMIPNNKINNDLLLGIILLVLLVGYSLTDRDDLTTPEKFLMDSVGWVQYIVNQPITYVSEKITDVKEMKHTYEENKLLREKLSEYKTVVYDLQEAEKENEELQQIMDIEESARDF